MARQLSPAELAIGGIAAMQGIHAVADIAATPASQDRELAGRFRALARMTNEHGDQHGITGMRTALMRLLYVATRTLGMPMQVRLGITASPPQIEAAILELTSGQSLEVQRLMRIAAECRTLPAFVRGVGDGADITSLGLAAAVVLREVLRVRGGNDPMRRWVVLGQVTSSVIATHYLQRPAVTIPA
jgi:hypothetical protein